MHKTTHTIAGMNEFNPTQTLWLIGMVLFFSFKTSHDDLTRKANIKFQLLS